MLSSLAHSQAAEIIYGGPAFDPTTGSGYQVYSLGAVHGGPDSPGRGVVSALKYDRNGYAGRFGLRWDTTTGPVELGSINQYDQTPDVWVNAVNASGTTIGYSDTHQIGTSFGYRAARWTATGVARALGTLGTNDDGVTNAYGIAINDAGTAVGSAEVYISNKLRGERAVRWDANKTAATELGNLGTASNGETSALALAINNPGTAVGYAAKYVGGAYQGTFAVRWNAGTTTAVELAGLSSGADFASTDAAAIADDGTIVGSSDKYIAGTLRGRRAVRWEANSTTPTELGNLGTSVSGDTDTYASAINAQGSTIGQARKYFGAYAYVDRAVRWDANTTNAFELGRIDPALDAGATYAAAINSAGLIVGSCDVFKSGQPAGQHAVHWYADGTAVDLNTLIDPASGWTLTFAGSITDSNWVVGSGLYDPDGNGPQAAYGRAFLMHIPEPGCVGLMMLAIPALQRRRRSVRAKALGCDRGSRTVIDVSHHFGDR